MKRFYTLVNVSNSNAGYEIHLDGKPVKTPLKTTLVTPHEMLANEIVREWSGQGEEIIPDTMPLTQTLSTRIDRVTHERQTMNEMVLKYFNTDLLCYRTDHPPELAEAQRLAWDPLLDWFANEFDYALETTTAIAALEHDQGAHDAVRNYVQGLDDDHFTVLQIVTGAAGSLILALAFVEKQITAAEIFAATHVEEDFKAKLYNEEKYGPDPAQEKKDKAMLADLNAAESYLNFIS